MSDTQTIAISGAKGLLGQALSQQLSQHGYTLKPIGRGSNPNAPWQALKPAHFEGLKAVVHLAGEPIAGPWILGKKQRILHSRQQGTRQLMSFLCGLEQPPETVIVASAVGFYGNSGPEFVTETSPPGQNYLAQVAQAWEEATELATHAGLRVVNARFGVVLSPKGGALAAMLPAFKLGLGGILGDGSQYFPWVHWQDVVEALQFCLQTPTLKGPVNICSPNPVTNAEFTQTLGQALHRPTVLPVPAWALKTLLPGMGEELLLASTRALPEKLTEAGFVFKHGQLKEALTGLLV